MWKDSYKKTRLDRIELLKDGGYITAKDYEYLIDSKVLTDDLADKFIENQISVYGLPFGIATNFLIDGEEYVIPMVVEEPSVIAASCNAAKIIKNNGGFKTELKERIMIGQISYYNLKNINESIDKIASIKENLVNMANLSQPNLVSIGGGARDIKVEIKDEFLIVYLYVDTVDAMGANSINTMLEVIAPIIEKEINATKLMSIISNYATSSIVTSTCVLDVEEEFGKRMELACKFANVDTYRAVTNNKGILNGIDALVIATGNDWRAIDAGVHAYASKNGNYRSLTEWKYENGKLYGKLEIPMPIASFGGSIKINELSKISFNILGNPDAKKLSKIAVCVGLAQNFAALRALVSEGIQKGHMKLQIKSFAIYAGAKLEEIDLIIEKFKDFKHVSIDDVKKVLKDIRK